MRAVAQAAQALPVARLLPLERGLYAFRISEAAEGRFVLIGAIPESIGAIEICDSTGRTGDRLCGERALLLVRAGDDGAVLGTAVRSEPSGTLPRLEIERLDRPSQIFQVSFESADEAPRAGIGYEAVAHIRGRGDLRFVDAAWIGRVAAQAWIEAFTLRPRHAAAAALEYKALMANGEETPWVPAGASCGTTGRALPLIGFAVRQRSAAGLAPLDCEYAGYFTSGVTTGPVRNGAPCRSPNDNDPLEGMQLRIAPRAPRRAG